MKTSTTLTALALAVITFVSAPSLAQAGNNKKGGQRSSNGNKSHKNFNQHKVVNKNFHHQKFQHHGQFQHHNKFQNHGKVQQHVNKGNWHFNGKLQNTQKHRFNTKGSRFIEMDVRNKNLKPKFDTKNRVQQQFYNGKNTPSKQLKINGGYPPVKRTQSSKQLMIMW